jgi:hypothetical protein
VGNSTKVNLDTVCTVSRPHRFIDSVPLGHCVHTIYSVHPNPPIEKFGSMVVMDPDVPKTKSLSGTICPTSPYLLARAAARILVRIYLLSTTFPTSFSDPNLVVFGFLHSNQSVHGIQYDITSKLGSEGLLFLFGGHDIGNLFVGQHSNFHARFRAALNFLEFSPQFASSFLGVVHTGGCECFEVGDVISMKGKGSDHFGWRRWCGAFARWCSAFSVSIVGRGSSFSPGLAGIIVFRFGKGWILGFQNGASGIHLVDGFVKRCVQVFGPPQRQMISITSSTNHASIGTVATARIQELQDGSRFNSNKLFMM